MLQDMLNAINDDNGVPQDMWLQIISVVGDVDPAAQVQTFGGRYYLTNIQRKRLSQLIPFMLGQPVVGKQLLLPAHTETGPWRCGRCKGPYHEATGHIFNADQAIVACGPCYGKFAAWQMKKYGWRPLTPKQLRKLDKKRKKAAKAEEKAALALVKRIAEEAAENERLYGKPRDAQPSPDHHLDREPGQNPILER